MRTIISTLTICLVLAGTNSADAQKSTTFRKGSLLINLTEGGTHARYTTIAPPHESTGGDVIQNEGDVNGDRDPLCIEYGLSNRLGISLSMGGDVLKLNTGKYYKTPTTNNAKAITSEITADINYHFLASRKVDLSAYLSVGVASVLLKADNGEHHYTYDAEGSIARIGGRARYYFTRRLGVVGMASVFAANLSSAEVKNNTMGAGYGTNIKGWAIEVGPCVRLLK